jgi:II/X family phage/plasmid replication protein
LNYELPPISTWPVYRLDVCYNWLFESNNEAVFAMDFIQRIDYPRKKKLLWDTSVMYQGSAYSVKFYLKGNEFLKHDYKEIESDRASELMQWAKRIVRFEVGLRRVYLSNFLGLKNVYLENISDDDVIIDMLKHFLSKVFFYINAKSMNTAEIRNILRENFTQTKALRLFQFHQGFYFDEELKAMYLKGGLDRSTIYRYKKDLQRVGIGFSLKETDGIGILEQLIIPSHNTRFNFLDSDER